MSATTVVAPYVTRMEKLAMACRLDTSAKPTYTRTPKLPSHSSTSWEGHRQVKTKLAGTSAGFNWLTLCLVLWVPAAGSQGSGD